jgi:hypothetical protein
MLLFFVAGDIVARSPENRSISGTIYFTNNTPSDRQRFPVELCSTRKKRLAAADQFDGQHFKFTAVKPGRYLLKLTWPRRCVLWYRVDITRESKTEMRILMDVDCAKFNGLIQDLSASNHRRL